MSSPFPEKQLPLHHKITRKRTLGKLRGDSETLFGVFLVSLWYLSGEPFPAAKHPTAQ